MRVIAGTLRRRTLEAPAGLATRPTSDRLRETLFNVLAPRMEGARFLDLYAGSGAVGIEAASRGAASVVMVERAEPALNVLRLNLEKLGLRGSVLVQARGVEGFLRRIRPEKSPMRFDVVFLDHVALPESALDGMLTYGRRALAPDGRLWVFERYEALAAGPSATGGSREKVIEHPIGRLRRLLGDVGLTCERLSPIEADGEHVIAAVAVPSRGVSRGTGAVGAA